MTRIQIQVPEERFAEIKVLAQRRERSLAETFRRGVELLLEAYPGKIHELPHRSSHLPLEG